MKSYDAIIIGAGVIGLSLALELRTRGAEVVVFERGEPGREASWAAAGMLCTHDPHRKEPLLDLVQFSAKLYPEFIARCEELSGKRAGYLHSGSLYVTASPITEWQERLLSPEQAAQAEPALSEASGYVYALDEASVDPRELLAALQVCCKHLAVEVHHEHAVTQLLTRGVRTNRSDYHGNAVVNCAGAWAAEIQNAPPLPIKPAKGQICSLLPSKSLRRILRSEDVYCVPRHDGKVIVGATVEDAGYDKRVDPATIQRLHQSAANLAPILGEARLTEAWAGLRPATPDGLPLLGTFGSLPGYHVAAGHFRDGILLAPATAVLMSQLILHEPTSVDLSPFSPERFVM